MSVGNVVNKQEHKQQQCPNTYKNKCKGRLREMERLRVRDARTHTHTHTHRTLPNTQIGGIVTGPEGQDVGDTVSAT